MRRLTLEEYQARYVGRTLYGNLITCLEDLKKYNGGRGVELFCSICQTHEPIKVCVEVETGTANEYGPERFCFSCVRALGALCIAGT